MTNKLISTTTKSWTVANSFGTDRPVGAVVTEDWATIEHNGKPREYRVYPHNGCENNGLKFYSMEAYSDQGLCTGCDLNEYNGIGD